jgi:Phage integrase family
MESHSNFPKPSEVLPSTIFDYVKTLKPMLTKSRMRLPSDAPLADVFKDVIEQLVSLKPTMSKNTFRHKKASIMIALRHTVKELPDSQTVSFQSAIDRLAGESSAGCRRLGTHTSSKKMKSITKVDFSLIKGQLEFAAKRSQHARLALLAIKILKATGLRPSELVTVSVSQLSSNGLEIVVENAKTTNGRGNGKTRTLNLPDLDPETFNALLDWKDAFASQVKNNEPLKLMSKIGKYLAKVARKSLSKRKKYPSLYSFRHQFAADAKASGYSTIEIAALMGHASDVTATKHYGRKTSGNNGMKIKPNAQDVATVRQTTETFMQKNSLIHSHNQRS